MVDNKDGQIFKSAVPEIPRSQVHVVTKYCSLRIYMIYKGKFKIKALQACMIPRHANLI